MYTTADVRKLERERDELLEAAIELERVVRLGIPQKAIALIAEHGLWNEFCQARIRIEQAIENIEGRK